MKKPINQTKRKQKFERWWNGKRKHSPSHDWLCHHARNFAKLYYPHPDVIDEIMFITKRFYKSEFRKLNKTDAWRLWRITNPINIERFEAIKAAGEHLYEQRKLLEEERKKVTKPTGPKITIKKKRTYTL
jgi:hypothetical protein